MLTLVHAVYLGMYTTIYVCPFKDANSIFLFDLQATCLRSVRCVCLCVLFVCNYRPHLPPTDDFGDGCHGDTSNAADELVGCTVLYTIDCCDDSS